MKYGPTAPTRPTSRARPRRPCPVVPLPNRASRAPGTPHHRGDEVTARICRPDTEPSHETVRRAAEAAQPRTRAAGQ